MTALGFWAETWGSKNNFLNYCTSEEPETKKRQSDSTEQNFRWVDQC